jgi:hypothetical protein
MDVPPVTLVEMKNLLRRFTSERQSWTRDRAALEFGELVLCIMQQADRLGVDLVTAGEAHLQRAVASARGVAPSAAPIAISLVAPRARPQ